MLYTYAAGTTTPLATYTDVGLTTANANPIVLDSAGRCTLFLLASSYKFVLKTAAGATVWTRDNVGAVPTTSIDNDVDGTAGVVMTAVQVAYLSDGSGALTAGRWYLADADLTYGSVTPEIAFVVTDVAAAAATTFRLSGRMTGFSGLTPGANYYVSATAGGITSTAPTNSRFVGQADSTSSLIITPNPPTGTAVITVVVDPRIKTLCNGRLSLTTAVPVTTADVTAAGTLYWVPYQGNAIALYSGSAWITFEQAQLSIAVPAVATQTYDVFVDYNAGTPALSLTAWTNDTTRATALTTQNGVLVLTGTLGKRYVGTVRTVSASQLNDSFALRHVWNFYHRVPRPMRLYEATGSWTYVTATYRQARATTTNQLDFVVGVEESLIEAQLQAFVTDSVGTTSAWASIGLDSTTTVSATVSGGLTVLTAAASTMPITAFYRGYTGIGRHVLVWLERGNGTATTMTWYGADGFGVAMQSGLNGTIWG